MSCEDENIHCQIPNGAKLLTIAKIHECPQGNKVLQLLGPEEIATITGIENIITGKISEAF